MLPIKRSITVLSGAVAANTAMLQLTAAVAAISLDRVLEADGLWILRGGRRRDGSQMNKEGLGRRPCTSIRSWLNVEATR